MAGTRSSSRLSGSSPASSQGPSPESKKRKASAALSPESKKGRKDKEQKTLEETLPDEDMSRAAEAAQTDQSRGIEDTSLQEAHNGQESESPMKENGKTKPESNTQSKSGIVEGHSEGNPPDSGQTTKMDSTGKLEQVEDSKAGSGAQSDFHGTVETTAERANKIPSNILEKGIIYFFARGRVGVDQPESVQDLARSYIVLRPLPKSAKLNEGAIEDLKNNRLLALPKKVLPKSHRDTFMTFVEKAGASIQELKDDFMKGSEYATKTTGVRSTPPVTPIGEGVYALTTTGRDSHMVYMLTIPSQIGEVQEDMGLKQQGSFHLSVKNPARPGPANSNLPQGPQFPAEVMDEFGSLGWMPLQPKHLNYSNTQFLLIGEGSGELGKAVEPTAKDQKHHKGTPQDEIETLEHEDEHRRDALSGDDTVFEDLGISHKEYSSVKTTW